MEEHAIAIARVSSGKQREEDQRPGLTAYSDRKGYILDEIVPVHGRSAFHGRHVKAILAAVDKHVRKGRATVVIFRHVDRMARMEPEEGMRFFLQLRDAGARIEFSEQEWLSGHFELLGLFLKNAHEESKIKQDRKLQGNSVRRNSGKLIGKVPWGYDPVLEDGIQCGITPNVLGREWIPRIYTETIEGKSLEAITRMLRGIPSPQKSELWTQESVRRLITSTTYCGVMRGNPNLKFKPLVSVELHKKANLAIASRNRKGRSTTKNERALVFPTCLNCYGEKREGAPSGMSPMYAQIRARWQYFKCAGHGPARKTCGAKLMPVADFESTLEAAMLADTRPRQIPEYVTGDDSEERRAIINEKIIAATSAGDYLLLAQLSQEAMAIEPTGRKASINLVDSGKTHGEHWKTLTRDQKREELANWVVVAGLTDQGVVVITRPRML